MCYWRCFWYYHQNDHVLYMVILLQQKSFKLFWLLKTFIISFLFLFLFLFLFTRIHPRDWFLHFWNFIYFSFHYSIFMFMFIFLFLSIFRYDRKDLSFRKIVDLTFVTSMGIASELRLVSVCRWSLTLIVWNDRSCFALWCPCYSHRDNLFYLVCILQFNDPFLSLFFFRSNWYSLHSFVFFFFPSTLDHFLLVFDFLYLFIYLFIYLFVS